MAPVPQTMCGKRLQSCTRYNWHCLARSPSDGVETAERLTHLRGFGQPGPLQVSQELRQAACPQLVQIEASFGSLPRGFGTFMTSGPHRSAPAE